MSNHGDKTGAETQPGIPTCEQGFPGQMAEARGFEPRKGANPNRISSTILCISSYANHGQIFLFLLITALAVGRPMMSKAGPFW